MQPAVAQWKREMDPKSNQIVRQCLPTLPSLLPLQLQQLLLLLLLLLCLFFQCLRIAFVFFVVVDFLFAYGASFRKWFVLSGRRRGYCCCAVTALSLRSSCPGHAPVMALLLLLLCEYRIKLQFAFICRVESEKKNKSKRTMQYAKENKTELMWN